MQSSIEKIQIPTETPQTSEMKIEPIPTEPLQISETKVEPSQTKEFIEEKLKYYFYGREIKPSIIVNNTERNQTEIKLEKNKIKWIRSEKETKVKINGDLFTLKKQKTLNNVEDEKGDVDFADNWEQIKLFKFGDRQLIGISMVSEHCTGIGCSVEMYLIYDLKTKTKNFFGTYRFLLDREFGLFDFKNDGKLDFLSGTYIGESDGVAVEIQNIYEIFTMDETGNFRLQSDNKDNKYFMKRVYKADDYKEIDNKFEQNWIEEIK